MTVSHEQPRIRVCKRGAAPGNTMVEYALAGSLIALIGVMGLLATGSRLNDLLMGMANQFYQITGDHRVFSESVEGENRIDEIEIPSINVEAVEAHLPYGTEIDRKSLPAGMTGPASGTAEMAANCDRARAECQP